MIFDGAEDGDVPDQFFATAEEFAVGLGEALEAVEVLDLRAVLLLVVRPDERFERLLPARHQFALALDIFFDPPEDGIERGDRELVRIIDHLPAEDVLLQEFLRRLVEHARALACG